MRPAWSVIFLTTLLGAGQGLLLALVATEWLGATAAGPGFYAVGAAIALVFTAAGAVASLFHLGHPERAWRAMAMWRTSWLSREGIAVIAFGAATFAYALAHATGAGGTRALGIVAALLAVALFVCTGMIYACIRFLQEWASPLTVANFIVLGMASGTTLAAAYAVFAAPALAAPYAQVAIGFTLLGLATRSASLVRNARLRPQSSLQSATGIHHPRIVQTSRGFTGGAWNLREFFHRATAARVRHVKWGFLGGAFVLPLLLLAAGAPLLAFVVQYAGLLAERWFFFAQARHPQNLYYQATG